MELIEQVNEAAKLEGKMQDKRKRLTTGKSSQVQELHMGSQPGHSPDQASQSPKEPGAAVTVKTVKGKEAKMEHPNTQQITEEVSCFLVQWKPVLTKQGCGTMTEAATVKNRKGKTVSTASNVVGRAISPVDAEHRIVIQEMDRDC